jgi:glutamyl-tRNA synthetase
MPTYHLAVVVDDSLMKISHAFRGEEWLPSAPVHILLWKYLFGLENMPQWAHFPLILGPNGKLSKRDGAKYGFPVFAMSWTDPKTGELTEGFKEKGFLPDAFINLLALLGWNDGTEQELFTKEELIEKFSIEKVHSGGAKFDYEKAKWFNHEYIKMMTPAALLKIYCDLLPSYFNNKDEAYKLAVFSLVKDRCHDITDLVDQSSFFFKTPEGWDTAAIQSKWNGEKKDFFAEWATRLAELVGWDAGILEHSFKDLATEKNIKPGELQLPLRIILVGGKFGPPVFIIAELLGPEETIARIKKALAVF